VGPRLTHGLEPCAGLRGGCRAALGDSIVLPERGFYVPVRWLEDKVEVVLAGQRLRDRYELVQTSQEKREWLLFKKA